MNYWTDQDYLYLCESFDAILLAPHITIERVAISELHILNEHPVNLSKYSQIFMDKRRDPLTYLKSYLSKFIRLLKSYALSIFSSNPSQQLHSADVLILSHLLSEGQLGSEDFYFGKLPDELAKRNLTCVVALHNHTGKDFTNIDKRWSSLNVSRVLFQKFLSLHFELSARRLLMKESSRLKKLVTDSNHTQTNRAITFAAQHAKSTSSIYTLGLYFQIKRLVSILKPKAIVVTYEGHAWERLAFAAAREVVPNIRCIGYQHSMLFPRQHAIKRLIGHHFDPDVILTAGTVTRDILRKVIPDHLINIQTAGTHRFKPHTLVSLRKKMHPKNSQCLVVPDGTLSECVRIFDFVLKVAKLTPTLNFIIRMHPVITYEEVFNVVSDFANLPDNVSLSTRSIEEDFNRCRWAIYRGSSAAIYAVMAGLRPFYIAENVELRIDPLFELEQWRLITSTPQELIKTIEIDCKTDLSTLELEWKPAREFCLNYFQPQNIGAFVRAIDGTL